MTGALINILALSISVTPIIVALLMLAPFFNKAYKAVWQYWLWLAVAIRLLLPFSFGEATPTFLKLTAPEIFAAAESDIRTGTYMGRSLAGAVEGHGAGFSLNLPDLLVLIYFAGVIIFFCYRLFGYVMFRKKLKRWSRKPSDKMNALLANRGQEYGADVISNGISVLICKRIPGPMTIGFFKPVLLLPTEEYDDIRLKLILAHELVHIKRHDLLYKLLLLLVSSLHWFNPVVHIMTRKASQGLEISCDAKVLMEANLDERKIYSHMIIELASQHFNCRIPALFNTFGSGKANLETRITSIFNNGVQRRGVASLTAAILIMLILGSAVQINAPAAAYEGSGMTEFYEVEAFLTNTENAPENKGVEKGADPVEEWNGDYTSEPEWQGFAEQERNQTYEPAEVVIIDLNQLKQNQEQTHEDFTPPVL